MSIFNVFVVCGVLVTGAAFAHSDRPNSDADVAVVTQGQNSPKFQDFRWWRNGDDGKGYYRNYDRNN